jgi:hypothetical protein
MKIAVVVGGWHWPDLFFRQCESLVCPTGVSVSLHVVSHREPGGVAVREEKRFLFEIQNPSLLEKLDQDLYRNVPTYCELERRGWNVETAPNTVGDWGFFNQWLEKHDPMEYDIILNCHDDNYIRRPEDLIERVLEDDDFVVMGNAPCTEASPTYVRGSFEFWRSYIIKQMGGKFDLGNVSLTREGLVDTPKDFNALSEWNNTGSRTQEWLSKNGYTNRVRYLSPYYRVSPYVIEGERGLLSSMVGAPWSMKEGLRVFPL